MSEFRHGEFEREAVNPVLRHFCPARSSLSLMDVDLEILVRQGKKLILLDVDNTLLPWRGEDLPQASLDWVEKAQSLGLRIGLISNTRHPERLARIAERLGVRAIRGKFKPSRQMFRMALSEFECTAEQAVMIGDQIFTDILGANRAGIEAIWVRPLTEVDFGGTRISRMGERMLRKRLYLALRSPGAEVATAENLAMGQEEADAALGGAGAISLLKVPVVRQFVKFVIVGGTSTIIDVGLLFLIVFFLPWNGQLLGEALGRHLIATYPNLFGNAEHLTDAAIPVVKPLTVGVAMLNSFYWNRRWTFKAHRGTEALSQLRKFLVVSLVGALLNYLITILLNNVIPGHPKLSLAVASAVAVVTVAFWNFTGQKLWAFRKRDPKSTVPSTGKPRRKRGSR